MARALRELRALRERASMESPAFTGEWASGDPEPAFPGLASMESPAFTGEWESCWGYFDEEEAMLQWSHQLSLVNGRVTAGRSSSQLVLQWSHQLSLVNGVRSAA